MKTNKLIELLQKADPSGDLEVCIDNHDIHFVENNKNNFVTLFFAISLLILLFLKNIFVLLLI